MFNNRKAQEGEIVGKALNYWEEFRDLHVKELEPRDRERPTRESPPPGWVKVNVDAAVFKDEGTRFGVVARDENGHFVMAAVCRERVQWSPKLAEIKAIDFGLKQLERYGFPTAIVETDCQSAFLALKQTEVSRLEAGALIVDLQIAAKRLDSIQWNFARRECNGVAHLLAHTSCNWDAQEHWEARPPMSLLPF
ncbi:unnamed protein product [Linum trigynum]|uniref:RNase H type-1 domain-containing protein n=1 Tax=Linum trigynum TaxID=586398 RepID=A0AAV2DMB1_9ROSI